MIDHIDHIVLTTRDKDACIRFYTEILGMRLEKFSTPTGERLALKFGHQKINLHEWGREFDPKAHVPVPGSLDLCFIAEDGSDRPDPIGLRTRPGPQSHRDLGSRSVITIWR